MKNQRHEWQGYLDILAKAGHLPDITWAPDDEQLRADVHQQIALNLVQGYMYYFGLDPDYPDFMPFFNSLLKLQPNPDDTYLFARLDPNGVYRITGERGSVRLLTFTVAYDFLGTSDTPGRFDGELTSETMIVKPDGTFEIIISQQQPAGYEGNWMKASPKTNYVLVRLRSYAWGDEVDPRMSIERVDGKARMGRMSKEEIDRRLRDLMVYAERTSRQWYERNDGLLNRGYVNKMELTRFEDIGGGHMQTYWQGVFKFERHECLILETEIPKNIRYWNVQMNDPLFNAMEYYYAQSSLNGHQATLDSDGKFRAVVSVDDPGIPNWLDTVDHLEGTFLGRWFGFGLENLPTPTLTKVPFKDLRKYLPADTPVVDQAARDKVLRARVRGGQLRRRW